MDDDPKVPAPGEPRPLLTEEPKENGDRKEENWLLEDEGLEADDPLLLSVKKELDDPLKREEPDSGLRRRPPPCTDPVKDGIPPSTPWERPGGAGTPGRDAPGRTAGTPGREAKLGLELKNPGEESRLPKVEEPSGKTNEELEAPPLPTPTGLDPPDPPRRLLKPGTPLNWKACKLSSSGALRSVVPSSRKESGPPPKPGKGGGWGLDTGGLRDPPFLEPKPLEPRKADVDPKPG